MVGEIAPPRPGRCDILVDVHAAAISFMDYLMVSGKYQMRPIGPFAVVQIPSKRTSAAFTKRSQATVHGCGRRQSLDTQS